MELIWLLGGITAISALFSLVAGRAAWKARASPQDDDSDVYLAKSEDDLVDEEEVDEEDDDFDHDSAQERMRKFGFQKAATASEFEDELLEAMDEVDWNPEAFGMPEPKQKLRVRITRMPDGDSGRDDRQSNKAPRVKAESTARAQVLRVISNPSGATAVRAGTDMEFRIMGGDAFEGDQGEAGAIGKRFAEELLIGNEVDLWVFGTDTHGRSLVAIAVPVTIEGRSCIVDYTAAMIRLGIGVRYAGSAYEPGVWYQSYDELEEAAREEGLGVWAFSQEPVLPHVWRSQKRRGNQRRNGQRPETARRK